MEERFVIQAPDGRILTTERHKAEGFARVFTSYNAASNYYKDHIEEVIKGIPMRDANVKRI